MSPLPVTSTSFPANHYCIVTTALNLTVPFSMASKQRLAHAIQV